jgi:hypothetical protein
MDTEPKESNEESPWSFIAVAAFLFLVAWWLHHVFTDLEQSGGSIRINMVVALLYKAFGKWGAVSLFGAFGGLSLYIGIRNLRQTQSPREQSVQTHETAISDDESGRIEKWVNLVSCLFRNAPLVLTWLLLVYSTREMLHFSSQLPLTLPRLARWSYTVWTILPFSLPAIFSLIFRTWFIEAVGLFFATAAMTLMSIGVFSSHVSPSGQFAGTAALVWVPIVELLWMVVLIHLLNNRRNENAA